MKKKNLIIYLGMLTYLLSFIVFMIFAYLSFIVIPKYEDWELFSFNAFGSALVFGLANIPFIIFTFIYNKNFKHYVTIILLFLSVELISIILAQDSIIISIFSTMIMDENYILIAYPIAILLSYFLSFFVLKKRINSLIQ